jgi:hypothetical protein
MRRPNGSLQEFLNPGSEFTWASFAYATNDPLEEALKPGYFDQWSFSLQPGDLILFGCNARRLGKGGYRNTPVRRALLMVTRTNGPGNGEVTVRLVQDWGGVEDGAAGPEAAAAAGGGVGPGSRPGRR